MIVNSNDDLKGKIKEVIISKGNQTTLFGEINQKIDEKFCSIIIMSEISILDQNFIFKKLTTKQ